MTRIDSMGVAIASGLLWLAALAANARTDPYPVTVDVYGKLGRFSWEETLNSSRLLQESGVLYIVGGRLKLKPPVPVWCEGIAECFGGNVNYDGALQDVHDGSLTPFLSETRYVGALMGFNLGLEQAVSQDARISPYAGLGARLWRRSLGEGSPYGYDEDWTAVHGALGCLADARLGKSFLLYARAEFRLALATNVRVSLAIPGGTRAIDVEPGKDTSAYLESGVELRRVLIAAYYETYRFDESPQDARTKLFQPRSTGDQIGIKAGLTF